MFTRCLRPQGPEPLNPGCPTFHGSYLTTEIQDRAANNGRTSRVREIVVDGVLEASETWALVTLGMGTFKSLLNPKNLKPKNLSPNFYEPEPYKA